MSFVNIHEGTQPGRPNLYVGSQPGGPDLAGNYPVNTSTPGKRANGRVNAQYTIREWEMKCHEGIGPRQPVFLLKNSVEPDPSSNAGQIYDIFNLPTLNYILASREAVNASKGEDPLLPKDVLNDYTFLGVVNTDKSEFMTNGLTISTTIQGNSLMYNIFGVAPQGGLHLFFILKAVSSKTDRRYVFNSSDTLSDTVKIEVHNKNSVGASAAVPLTTVMQAVPYACVDRTPPLSELQYEDRNKKKQIGGYMRIGTLLEGMYYEDRHVVNNTEYMAMRVDEIEHNTDITVSLNP